MRILIYGAGAIGGFFGGVLTVAGRDVTLVARGPQYRALADRGLKLEGPRSGRPERIRVRVCEPGAEQGRYDLVCVTLKAHQIAGAAEHIASLRAPEGAFLFLQNGLPWWYFDAIDSPLRGTRLSTLDPDGTLARAFPSETIVGGVAYKPSDLVEPGWIRLADQANDYVAIGEVDNRLTPRLRAIAEQIEPTGWRVDVSQDIRKSKWNKLLSNAVWNMLGAITQATAFHLAGFRPTRDLAVAMVREVLAVAASVGVELEVDPPKLVDAATQRVPMPTSTLQDVRNGRALELDVLNRAIVEIGRLTGVSTPMLETVGACVAMLDRRIVEDKVAFPPIPLAPRP